MTTFSLSILFLFEKHPLLILDIGETDKEKFSLSPV